MSDTFRLEYREAAGDQEGPISRRTVNAYVGVGIYCGDDVLDIYRHDNDTWVFIANGGTELYRGPFPTPDAIFQGFAAMVAKRLAGEES